MQTIMKTRTETQSREKISPYCYFLTITTHGYQLLRKPLGKKLRRPVRKYMLAVIDMNLLQSAKQLSDDPTIIKI